MMLVVLPAAAEPLMGLFRCAFTRPSFERFVVLCVGTIVTFGRRTVSRILWTLGRAAPGHASSYHRLLSRARWSLWRLGSVLATRVLLETAGRNECVKLVIDDTVTEHTGRRVYGKGCHRDAVRSGQGQRNVKKWGHRWIVLAILVKLPFCPRPWALPVLCALYRKPKPDQPRRRHKTPCDLARGLLATLLHGFPQRRFIVMGDGGFASHDLAWFCHRHRDRLTLIARGRSDLRLYALPRARKPCRQTLWRRRTGRIGPSCCRKGPKLPAPAKTIAAAGGIGSQTLQWYGQSQREMEVMSGCGGWYGTRDRHGGKPSLVPIRWVYTHQPLSDREDWFYSTDPTLSGKRIVELFAGRWAIEVTFEETRAHLGLETPRQRCQRSVLRTTPCLLGCFSLVSLIFVGLWRQSSENKKCFLHHTPCYHKTQLTFGDALYAVRRSLWDRCLLKHVLGDRSAATLPPSLKQTLLSYLAEAA
jgi:hypothetical protein